MHASYRKHDVCGWPFQLQRWVRLWILFKLDTSGNETVLHSFRGSPDGWGPSAGLIMDKRGNLYGTTVFGGSSDDGIVFKLDSSGDETVLYSFTGGNDGGNPEAGLIMDKTGTLSGTTAIGGASGVGTVFKLDTSGNMTVLHSFTDSPDGAYPSAGLMMDKEGNLYGTTVLGGTGPCNFVGPGCGTIFKLIP